MAAALLLANLKKTDWREWLKSTFPTYVTSNFAPRHVEFWEWVDAIQPKARPRPFCAFWPRGGAKSTSAELAAVRLGENRQVRKYCWYVSSTQDKADKHVESIADLLERSGSERLLNKYGSSKGWRRERLRTSKGFTVDALGLDTGARGAKVEDQRPDLIILDDFDENEDSTQTTLKKIDLITKSILPAGSNDCAVLVIQNLIHPESIASKLADGRADFLSDRIVSGPFPAVENLECEFVFDDNLQRKIYKIVGGKATWEGQSLEVCQSQILLWGYTSFKQEAQHEVDRTGGLWDHIEFQHFSFGEKPDYIRTSVWVDPAVTSTDQSDSMGISAGGVQKNGIVDGLYWWEAVTSPEDALKRAIRKAVEIKATKVGVETDQGGDTWQTVYNVALTAVKEEFRLKLLAGEISHNEYDKIVWPKFDHDKAGSGYGSKAERNAKMMVDYENGKVRHMTGTHTVIEKALLRFPKKPLDVADSMFWLWNDLSGNKNKYAGAVR